jgi:lysophospholipase L1-like esterase
VSGRLLLVCGALAAFWCGGAAVAEAPAGAVLLDMDSLQLQPGTFGPAEQPVSVGTAALVPGHSGQANALSFVADAKGGFFSADVTGGPEWDEAGGLSFWVKGDGSQSWGGIELIDGSYQGRYAAAFPIDSTEWRRITIRWEDFIPEIAASSPLGPHAPTKPSSIRHLRFGKWFYWRDYPAHSYAVDDVSLFTAAPGEASAPAVHTAAPSVGARLRARQPITILTIGDSLSDKRHWANREVLWSEILQRDLEQTFGAPVTIVNGAVGGTELNQGMVILPRWLALAPHPDVITVWFGYNDWSAEITREQFRDRLRAAVSRLRRLTEGRSEILLLTTAPAVGRWTEMEPLAQVEREVAKEMGAGLADVAAAFHRAGDADETARKALYCSDEVHLGAAGHALAAATVQRALVGE